MHSKSAPADVDFVNTWGSEFHSRIPLCVDSTGQMLRYYDEAATPLNMLVDAATMQIVRADTGFDMASERGAIEGYLGSPCGAGAP